jgi:hypothetical protein
MASATGHGGKVDCTVIASDNAIFQVCATSHYVESPAAVSESNGSTFNGGCVYYYEILHPHVLIAPDSERPETTTGISVEITMDIKRECTVSVTSPDGTKTSCTSCFYCGDEAYSVDCTNIKFIGRATICESTAAGAVFFPLNDVALKRGGRVTGPEAPTATPRAPSRIPAEPFMTPQPVPIEQPLNAHIPTTTCAPTMGSVSVEAPQPQPVVGNDFQPPIRFIQPSPDQESPAYDAPATTATTIPLPWQTTSSPILLIESSFEPPVVPAVDEDPTCAPISQAIWIPPTPSELPPTVHPSSAFSATLNPTTLASTECPECPSVPSMASVPSEEPIPTTVLDGCPGCTVFPIPSTDECPECQMIPTTVPVDCSGCPVIPPTATDDCSGCPPIPSTTSPECPPQTALIGDWTVTTTIIAGTTEKDDMPISPSVWNTQAPSTTNQASVRSKKGGAKKRTATGGTGYEPVVVTEYIKSSSSKGVCVSSSKGVCVAGGVMLLFVTLL